MAKYRAIQMSFWTDPKVVDDFTPEDKYFYLYLMTNPHTNLCGCYELSMKLATDETGYTRDTIEKLLDRMEKVHDVIRYSRLTKEVLILNWGKHNWTKSKDFVNYLEKEIADVKTPEFADYLRRCMDGGTTVVPRWGDGGGTTVSVLSFKPNTNNHLDLNNKDLNTEDLKDTRLGEETKDLNGILVTNNTKKAKPEKHQYGEYKHVLLTDEERDRLFNDYGEVETLEAIKFLDECIEMKGYKYKNHNLALRKWVFRAVNEEKNRSNRSGGNKRDNQLDIALAYIKEHENEQNGSNETVGSHKSFFS